MAFANVYDVTFPPNTQQASLGAADMQEIQLNVQQRMATISGVSTAMPAFASDAQPTNWNGILFFATDNGHIYQFNNPSWTDVTAAFLTTGFVQAIGTPVTNTGNTTNNTIYTLNTIGGAGLNTQWRITFSYGITIGNGNTFSIAVNFGGTQISGPILLPTSSRGITQITGGNKGALNAQSWDSINFDNGNGNYIFVNDSTAINTGAPVAVTVTCQNNVSSNIITFYRMILEVL